MNINSFPINVNSIVKTLTFLPDFKFVGDKRLTDLNESFLLQMQLYFCSKLTINNLPLHHLDLRNLTLQLTPFFQMELRYP